MGGIACQHLRVGGDIVGSFFKVLIVDLAHRFADPIGAAACGNGEADIVQRLVKLGADMMGAVLVAHDRDDGDLAEGRQALAVVGLAEKGIHPFQYALGDAGRLPQPDRRAEQDYVGVQDLTEQTGPVIAVPFIRRHAGLDVQRRDADDFALCVVLGKRIQHLLQQAIRGRAFAGAFEGAVESENFQGA